MKKLFNTTFTVITLFILFCLTGCPFLGEDINKYTCYSAQELTDYMNNLNFGSTFTLKDSKYVEKKDYKRITVYLEADNLPGKTVCAWQSYSYDRSAVEAARTTIPYVSEFIFTDYYYVKYSDEVLACIEEAYSPVLTVFVKNQTYKIAIKPDSGYWVHSLSYEVNYYNDATTFIDSKEFYIKAYCLINKDLSTDPAFERKYNALRYDLQQQNQGHIEHNFFFKTSPSASQVTEEEIFALKQ